MIFKTILREFLYLDMIFFMSCQDLPAEIHLDTITVDFVAFNVCFYVEASFFGFWVYGQSTKFLIRLNLSKAFDSLKFSRIINFTLSLKCVILDLNSLNLV
jgi:hypothetical protein